MRQGCLLSPLFFNIFTADEEKIREKEQDGGVLVGKKRKIWTLAYVDDLVLLAKGKNEMRRMMGRLERYMERKKLMVNVGKSKIIRFRKGEGRNRRMKWNWKGEEVEVKSFRYLGYMMLRNQAVRGAYKRGIKESSSSNEKGLEDRKKKIWRKLDEKEEIIQDTLVNSILLYGAKIWERKGKSGKSTREICEIDAETGLEDSKIYVKKRSKDKEGED